MRLRRKWFFAMAPFIIALFVFVIGELVMQLWNWVAVGLFALPHITFWEAWGLLLLCRILFGSMHGGGGRRRYRSERLTPEERERLQHKLHDRWGCDTPPAGGAPATS